MKLVVTRDDFVESTGIRVFFENDEMLEQAEKPLPVEYPAHEGLQLQTWLRLRSLTPIPSPRGRGEMRSDFL